jgi:hypothetical protein
VLVYIKPEMFWVVVVPNGIDPMVILTCVFLIVI